ncbi:uncharacterized protein MONOS_5542 [Monocercomonoides exilis]|uniref:uncharacterized protein n=1 Tax=Monocercomonoides exilis TaxID=2049356 RepID=UPI0035594887|nr:hypothetical protein MONOS_5542 [Monocercomonoides exilis]|eukprot:MONOS_5542.1-p1 / transcript=MONOS_5542.1 / gene=MONOS_5542 / organism=Monocercomonoides_exilis_PA203 / gene_product=unspecified product / transcript_product=unspecified product / location=Mono_scaffold00162:90958-91167(-) / protein_length=70 / sequence_SO=supercontig / SO=protein_coding / is_pseudo=false
MQAESKAKTFLDPGAGSPESSESARTDGLMATREAGPTSKEKVNGEMRVPRKGTQKRYGERGTTMKPGL